MKRIVTFITSNSDNVSFEVGKLRGITPADQPQLLFTLIK